MKNLLIITAFLICVNAFAIDTLKLESKITDVTVFFDGAQISRKTDLKLTKGKHVVMFSKLPMELDPESVRVIGIENAVILNVKHELTYNQAAKKFPEENAVQDKIDAEGLKLKEVKNKIEVFEIEEQILLENSKLGSNYEGSKVSEIKEAADYYRLKLNEIRSSKLKLVSEAEKIQDKIKELYSDLNKMVVENRKTYSQVYISIDCKEYISQKLEINYYISGAGWEPGYDFRVDDITKPLTIVYNAVVFQSTGEDWKNINITLSNGNPTLTGYQPEIKTWYLGRQNPYETKKTVKEGSGGIKGVVRDQSTQDVLPFANVVLEKDGKTITGASTDIDGNYIIKPIPAGYYDLRFMYIGYNKKEYKSIRINPDKFTFLDASLNPSAEYLAAVEIKSYKVPLIDKEDPTRISVESCSKSGASLRCISSEVQVRGARSHATIDIVDNISNNLRTGSTNIEYQIEIPYTILSDGNDNNIKIKEVRLPVDYVYHAVPKLDNDVFLAAEIADWSQLNLLSGKANIFFQGTFTGSTNLNSDEVADTLKLSLGRDNSISVKREINRELADKRIIGKTVKETIGWDITLRNNKNAEIKIVVEDQIPLSDRKSIEIERLDVSGAKVNERTGKLGWEIRLAPGEKKTISFKYSVKYPDYQSFSYE